MYLSTSNLDKYIILVTQFLTHQNFNCKFIKIISCIFFRNNPDREDQPPMIAFCPKNFSIITSQRWRTTLPPNPFI